MNAQTVPKSLRTMFRVFDPGRQFIQIDLRQAEAQYVAWEAPEPILINMYQSGVDIHKFVAAHIFKKLESDITHDERQLGKKSGHGANYGMAPKTFAASCLDEIGLVITEGEAARILREYHSLFPGIRTRQNNIQRELKDNDFTLITPFGRSRHFLGRCDDNMFREAYAFCPQSTIPDIINSLMLFLGAKRDELKLDFDFLLQGHDSLLLEAARKDTESTMSAISDISIWHPKIHLPGGQLIIPVDIEIGTDWGHLEKVK